MLGLIRDQVARGYDPSVEAQAAEQKRALALSEAREALSGRPGDDSERFERVLARAEKAYPIREDHEYCLTSTPFALLRLTLLEAGRRLAERGQIAGREDILFLEMQEARDALSSGKAMADLVARRKGELAWVKAHPGPAYYGKPPGPPPPLAAFPPEARCMMGAMMWMMESSFATQFMREKKADGAAELRTCGLPWEVRGAGAGDPKRRRVLETPAGGRAGQPHHSTGLVGAVLECRGPGDRQRRRALTPGYDRQRVWGAGCGGHGQRHLTVAGRSDGMRGWQHRAGGDPIVRGRGCPSEAFAECRRVPLDVRVTPAIPSFGSAGRDSGHPLPDLPGLQ